MIRTFVAVDIEPHAAQGISALQDALARSGILGDAKVRWLPVESLHFTLQFLGSIDSGRAEAILAALEALHARPPFEIHLHGLGVFPDGRRSPHTLWLGVEEGSEALASLAGDVNRCLQNIGFEAEKRTFVPHLTIARIKEASHFDVQTFDSVAHGVGRTRISKVTLFRSDLHPDGAKYEPLGTVRLGS